MDSSLSPIQETVDGLTEKINLINNSIESILNTPKEQIDPKQLLLAQRAVIREFGVLREALDDIRKAQNDALVAAQKANGKND